MDIRWKVLIGCCVTSFAQDFFYDEPSALVQRLTESSPTCTDGTEDCLHLDMTQFSLFFSAYSWASAASAVLAGWLIDRYGVAIPLWITNFCLFIGALMFAAGSYATTTSSAFGWMVTGRVVYGIGSGAIVVIAHRMKASWFHYKELGLSFSLHVICGRIGSALSFLIVGTIVGSIGLRGCLWLGFAITLLGCVACVFMARIEVSSEEPTTPTNVRTFLTNLDGVFWSLAAAAFLLYAVVSTFTANGVALMATLHGYSEADASYITGIVYYICCFSPLIGFLLDRYGHRDYWITASSVTLLLAFVLYMGPNCPGWLLSTIIGIAYAVFPPTIWSTLPLIVPDASTGLANGLLKLFQYIGSGVIVTVGGVILDQYEDTDNMRWRDFAIYLLILSFFGVICALLINIYNRRTGYRLTPSQLQRQEKHSASMREITPLNISYAKADDKESKFPNEALPS